ncbi:unnamed protein product [Caenorhabditis angaria]|uniref:Tyrosine-protein phosphatase domain-containing protein n=1 Tax=Caenorhabditis angaria TaxID=860376 RepID=A0A9P1I888_9PELO|nr:unnamed protein product [Caenorhabditis angaria]
MLGGKKGGRSNSKKTVKKQYALKKKDTLEDDDDLFGGANSPTTHGGASSHESGAGSGKPVRKRNSHKLLSHDSRGAGSKTKKEASQMGNVGKASRNSGSRKSKKGVRVDPNMCASVKRFEEAVRGMMSYGGIGAYYETRLKAYTSPSSTTTAADSNPTKNRTAVTCYDHSRVKLAPTETRKSDYINASHITFANVNRKYILAQYPLPDALEDFWAMIFDNEVETVLAVFNPFGDPEIKEFQDKPTGSYKRSSKSEKRSVMQQSSVNQISECRPLSIRETKFNMTQSHREIAMTSKRCALADSTAYFPLKEGQFVTIGRFFVHTRKVEVPEKAFRPFIYTIEVLPEGCSECKFVRIINYPQWKAKRKPNVKVLLYMLRAIGADPLQKGPILLHCDNGLNRSAVLLLTDVISSICLEGKPLDIDEIFRQIRQQRGGAFQLTCHFTFAIYAIASLVYLRCKSRGAANSETLQMLKNLIRDLGKQCPSKEVA